MNRECVCRICLLVHIAPNLVSSWRMHQADIGFARDKLRHTHALQLGDELTVFTVRLYEAA